MVCCHSEGAECARLLVILRARGVRPKNLRKAVGRSFGRKERGLRMTSRENAASG